MGNLVLCGRSFLVSFFSLLVVEPGCFGFGWFRRVLFFLLLSFLVIRLPYVYGLVGLVLFIFFYVFGLFLSAFCCRLRDPSLFLSHFVPEGVSLGFSVFICCVETLSYMIRPLVLMLRPLMNLSIGWLGGHYILSGLCVWSSSISVFFSFNFLFVLFLNLMLFLFVLVYEWCVGCVQWYIVESIVVVESET